MKKFIFSLLIPICTLSLAAQGSGMVAERFRVLTADLIPEQTWNSNEQAIRNIILTMQKG